MANDLGDMRFSESKGIISKVLVLLLVTTAIYILLGIWIPIIRIHKFNSISDFIYLFIFPLPCTFLAISFLHAAKILYRGISPKGIHKLSVCLSLLFAALVLIIISGFKETLSPKNEPLWDKVPTSIIMIAGGLFFLQIQRWLSKSFSVSQALDYRAHRKSTKLYFGFLGLTIWSDIAGTTEFLSKDPNFEHVPANPWLGALITFGSIPIAVCCYQIGLKLFLKKPQNTNRDDGTSTGFLDSGSSPA